jgi:predicted sugar kinase
MIAAQDLLTQALLLPLDERAKLARQLLLSLEPEMVEEDYESAWSNEIAERVKRLDDGRSVTHDWREAHAAIRSKLRETKS